MKKVLLFVIFLNIFSLVASEFDREIVVLNQTRNDKVKTVFTQMMTKYEEEDLTGFFTFVSEDRFNQDYMTFHEAIEEDLRVYDILNIDTWVNKITDDGVKRYLYVQWEKRYESTDSETEINQRGYSRFLFDEINGNYKLIELAGNNFWGASLPEWKEEVPEIAGQEPENGLLPDLIITSATSFNGDTTILIKNQGDKDITSSVTARNMDQGNSVVHNNGIAIGEIVTVVIVMENASDGDTVTVDPNDEIEESDETNNNAIVVLIP